HRLLRACIARGLPYTIVPGASSVLTALIGSGFPAERFFFGGFLPVKSGGRERELLAAAARAETTIFFESPHRLLKTLEVCATHFPGRELCVARELTKQFEEFRCGAAPELLAHYAARAVKGEIVFLIRGNEAE
ncbi:MAG TPA: SAM-dependent methyltransferase, partial [Chthoniobacteraceae bacterium]|nr:SAM-dependent methyltransferase [Chthoniobacteraceae bacterium]